MKPVHTVSITILLMCSDYISNIHCRNVKVAIYALEYTEYTVVTNGIVLHISNTFQVQWDAYEPVWVYGPKNLCRSHLGGPGEMI